MSFGKRISLGILLVVLLIWALPASAYDENVVEIKGTVFAVDNDANGNVIAVSILDAGGRSTLSSAMRSGINCSSLWTKTSRSRVSSTWEQMERRT